MPAPSRAVHLRAALGGALMGLANLVPGISGGTMLLATGIYPRFVESVAEVSALRFRRASLLFLLVVGGCAALAIVALAGPVRDLVVERRAIAYSLFIGLTLGGAPLLWSMLQRPLSKRCVISIALGVAAMAALSWLQANSSGGGGSPRDGIGWMLLAGVLGASAMILPGISGGYLLLLLGAYVPILTAIDTVKQSLRAGAWDALAQPVAGVVLPVGIGVAIGIAGVSNLLKALLRRAEQETLGALLGVVVGAVLGLWPFARAQVPAVGDLYKGEPLTAERLRALSPADYPVSWVLPSAGEATLSVLLIALGLAATLAIGRIGGSRATKP